MSGTDDVFRTGNPFPSSPVVQLRVLSRRGQPNARTLEPPVNVGTRAFATLEAQTSEYLGRQEAVTTRGRAVALIGPVGLGKTHLARGVVTTAQAQNVPLWVIDQPSPDMGRVYGNQLMAGYRGPQHVRRLRGRGRALPRPRHRGGDGGRRATRSRRAHPPGVHRPVAGRRTGLAEGRAELRLRPGAHPPSSAGAAAEITGHRQFATALALLTDRRFNRDVWTWLKGGAPVGSLVDRGITAPIDGVAGVFDALTVFGFLHGQVGKPYLVVVDNLDEVLESPDHERNAFLNSFETLVNTCVDRGSLLVLCITPEPWSRLSAGLHERILQIWPDRIEPEGDRSTRP